MPESETSPPELPEPPPLQEPQDVSVYIAPGMQTATFEELLTGAGIVTGVPERFGEIDSRLIGMQAQLDKLKTDLEAQIEALRQHIEGTAPPA